MCGCYQRQLQNQLQAYVIWCLMRIAIWCTYTFYRTNLGYLAIFHTFYDAASASVLSSTFFSYTLAIECRLLLCLPPPIDSLIQKQKQSYFAFSDWVRQLMALFWFFFPFFYRVSVYFFSFFCGIIQYRSACLVLWASLSIRYSLIPCAQLMHINGFDRLPKHTKRQQQQIYNNAWK